VVLARQALVLLPTAQIPGASADHLHRRRRQPGAERAAAHDAERLARRLAGWEELRRAQARWREAGAPLAQLVTLSDRLAAAALCLGGFYRRRGEWGKRNDRNQ
jgi:hypothetical protein